MNSRNLKFIFELLKPFRFIILGQLTVGLIWAIDLGLRPFVLKILIDKISFFKEENLKDMIFLIIVYLLMSLLITVSFRFFDYLWLRLNPPLKRHVGYVLMSKMMEHSLFYFQNQFSGNLVSKIKDVMSGIPDLVKLCISQFFSHFIALTIAIIIVGFIGYQFSLLLFSWSFIFVIGSVFFFHRARKLCANAAEVRSIVIGQMVDILSNIMSVHLFSAKKNEAKTLRGYLDDYVVADQKRDWWFLWMFSFQGLSFVAYQVLVFVYLVSGLQAKSVTPGDFALLITINMSIISALWSLSTDLLAFAELTGNIEQGLKVVLEPIDIQDQTNAKQLEVSQGRIDFQSVKFRYQQNEILFQDKSVTIQPGQKVGLVGYSGGGKSTFVNLILRLYDVTDGAILIDGQNIRDVTQDSLRENIAMIPQDPSLFHRSLMENIRYARIEATDEAVINAARQAHAHEFILELPEGYDSLVGERGVKLSGGQRQRIAIARAFLKNAPILILDEATSQLDSLTEQYIQESLWALMQHKTTIVIAHRLSTLLSMDRILVFDKGKIVEDGTHHELLKTKGLYHTLWHSQLGGFLLDTA